MTKRLGAVLVLVLLSGCGDVLKELLTTASCNNATAGICMDYSGPSGTALTRFETSCATSLGTNSAAACTATNRIGSCTLSPFTGVSEVIRYYSGAPTPWTVSLATTNCTAAGVNAGVAATFTPG
jgi:uncharacterized protein YceK